ncbi:MAG: HNH endonuclease signature motif containing protein [Acidimicrobiales bacterium]
MSTRTAPANLYAALVARDQHCRFPGCDRPAEWCEGHHVPSYLDGGPTSLTTMVLDCSRHHHLVHQPGWTDKLLPDGTYIVTNPQGQTFTTYPPGRPPDLFEPPPP